MAHIYKSMRHNFMPHEVKSMLPLSTPFDWIGLTIRANGPRACTYENE